MDIVLQLDTERHVGVANWVGTAVPLHASSAGKVVLADLGADELEATLGTAPLPAFTERTITDVRVLSAELGHQPGENFPMRMTPEQTAQQRELRKAYRSSE